MLAHDDTADREISAHDKQVADVFWWILFATRFVFPLYVIYAVYLYWTMPTEAYLINGY